MSERRGLVVSQSGAGAREGCGGEVRTRGKSCGPNSAFLLRVGCNGLSKVFANLICVFFHMTVLQRKNTRDMFNDFIKVATLQHSHES